MRNFEERVMFYWVISSGCLGKRILQLLDVSCVGGFLHTVVDRLGAWWNRFRGVGFRLTPLLELVRRHGNFVECEDMDDNEDDYPGKGGG